MIHAPAAAEGGIRLGPGQSPVVSTALAKKRKHIMAGKAIKKAGRSFLGVFLLLVDRYLLITASLLCEAYALLFYWLEMLVLAILILSLLYNSVLLITVYLTEKGLKVTAIQRKLLGIHKKATGYISIPSPSQFGAQQVLTPVTVHTPPLHYLTPSSSFHATPQSGSVVGNYTPCGLTRGSPNDGGKISDNESLERFLRYEQDKECNLLSNSPQTPPSQYGSDVTPTLRKYHLSTRSHSPHLGVCDSPISSDARTIFQVLTKLGIRRNELTIWTSRCKKWITERIFCPVASEIVKLNKSIQKMGNVDLQIGSVGLPKLQQMAKMRARQFPSLPLLVPYLELCANQDYIVSRIQELSKGANLSAFHWRSGGSWRGKPWDQSLPNDSQIVMHLFCTYLDSQYPPSPQYPADGKAFSSRHFLKAPEKTSSTKDNVCIYQESANPPEYKVLHKENCVTLSKGRSNVFGAIVVFLYCIKTYYRSNLGPIHLDKTGVNALWIIEEV